MLVSTKSSANLTANTEMSDSTTVYRTADGQYKVTIPRSVGEYHDLDGKQLKWKRGSARNKMEVVIVEGDE